ncbi:MAG TPA: efflux transporter outer membrane subunit [Usitatibacter sp.]|nr:efflux transporter outer membrane subunit [Usitatibacter sp.]
MKLQMLVAALVLAGCATVPDIDASRIPAAPAQFKEAAKAPAAPAMLPADGAWWKTFNDPVLDDLVARAERNNASIETAAARLAQARAFAKAADAERMPQASLDANVGRLGGIVDNTSGPARTFGAVGANLSYEVDLFGKLSKASEAARLDAQSRESLLVSTRLLVDAEVSQTYLAIRALDEERALVRSTVAAYQDTLDLTERRYRAGDVAELDVERARTEVAATESDAFALDRRRAELEHALAVLVGDVSSRFDLPVAPWSTALPTIPAGVPSTVLTRRPDVRAAQSAMQAAAQRVGVAKADWFPDVALTASGGYASSELGQLLKWPARAWLVGAVFSTPLFDGGRRTANIANSNAQLDESMARYREQVLVAFRDVEDQLSALRILASQSDAQARAVASATRSTTISDVRYRNGLVSQLDLLDARRSELRNRREALQVRAAQYQATVGLVRALGGGWGNAS